METTQEEIVAPQKPIKKLTKAGLISIIASSAVVLVAVITTLVLCLSKQTVYLHIDSNTIEYSVKTSSLFSEPTDLPLAEGEIVLGYYEDEEYTKEFNFDTKIKQDTHIYAQTKQLPKQTITFDSNGIDLDIAPVTKYENTKLVLPDLSEHNIPGYSFSGWARYLHGNEEYDLVKDNELYFEDQTNIKLYAVWTPVKYTISFVGNNYTVSLKDGTTKKISDKETPVLFMEYTINDTITLPTAEKNNKTFLGWEIIQENSPSSWTDYIEKDSLNIGSGHYGDITILANFKANAYRILFQVDDERKDLFTGTDYEYLVNPQSEDDYVYWDAGSFFKTAYKLVNGEKYYVFIQDPTDSSSSYVAPYITGMGKNNQYWLADNNNGKTTNIKAKGTTQPEDLKKVDNCIILTPIWAELKITLCIMDPDTGDQDDSDFETIKTKYSLSTRNVTLYYGKTYTDFLPTPVDNQTYYEFDGWYTEDGTKIETFKWTDLETTKMNLYAHWK